jgi:hypothetical protein
MSQIEAQTIGRLKQARDQLLPLQRRLIDIEARMASAKSTDQLRPEKISLREFTSNFLKHDDHAEEKRSA